jgi:plastocyanin
VTAGRWAPLAASLLLLSAGCSVAAPDVDSVSVVDGRVALEADASQFSVGTIRAPTGRPFTIAFTNAEDVPHNVSVYVEDGGRAVATGEILNVAGGPVDVRVPALPRGAYRFVCDVHPELMTGTLVVDDP